MKIEKLIEAFELAIPTYQQAVDENWNLKKLLNMKMHFGICHFVDRTFNMPIYEVFDTYYKNYVDSLGFLYDVTYFNSEISNINQRLNFMKNEVKDLKRLLKQGYTDL